MGGYGKHTAGDESPLDFVFLIAGVETPAYRF
jgi:hypothetical protein